LNFGSVRGRKINRNSEKIAQYGTSKYILFISCYWNVKWKGAIRHEACIGKEEIRNIKF
jgi:hypothetical protein